MPGWRTTSVNVQLSRATSASVQNLRIHSDNVRLRYAVPNRKTPIGSSVFDFQKQTQWRKHAVQEIDLFHGDGPIWRADGPGSIRSSTAGKPAPARLLRIQSRCTARRKCGAGWYQQLRLDLRRRQP